MKRVMVIVEDSMMKELIQICIDHAYEFHVITEMNSPYEEYGDPKGFDMGAPTRAEMARLTHQPLPPPADQKRKRAPSRLPRINGAEVQEKIRTVIKGHPDFKARLIYTALRGEVPPSSINNAIRAMREHGEIKIVGGDHKHGYIYQSVEKPVEEPKKGVA